MTRYITKKFRLMAGTMMLGVALSQPAARADAVLDWNTVMQATVSDLAPFLQARFAAITQLAVFEAVNAITKDYKPYVGIIPAGAGASAEAAAIAASHTVLKAYFPAKAASLDAARVSSLAMIADGPAKSAGIATGETAAASVMALRNNDGSAPPVFYLPGSSEPGQWQTTPSCTAAGGAFFQWRNVKPFVLRSADQFQLDEPPALNSARFARDYHEIKAVGGTNSTARTQDRTDVARYYGGVSPVGVWNPVARQLSIAAAATPAENARALALLNMAMSDAAVATFDTKYRYNFWRPETAIQAGYFEDKQRLDADPSFRPLISSPCFPGYASAHATLSGAAREVLEGIFGSRRHAVVLSSPIVPGITLRYGKLKEITADIDDARIYGGIHFRFDQEAGADLGRLVGEYVYKHSLGSARGSCEDR